jgi:hypothetical protein
VATLVPGDGRSVTGVHELGDVSCWSGRGPCSHSEFVGRSEASFPESQSLLNFSVMDKLRGLDLGEPPPTAVGAAGEADVFVV